MRYQLMWLLPMLLVTGCWDQINAIKFIQEAKVQVTVSTDVRVVETGERLSLPNTRYQFLTYDNPLPRPNDPLPTFKHRGEFTTDGSGKASFTTLYGYVKIDAVPVNPDGSALTLRKVFDVSASSSTFVIGGETATRSASSSFRAVLPVHSLYTDCFPKVCND